MVNSKVGMQVTIPSSVWEMYTDMTKVNQKILTVTVTGMMTWPLWNVSSKSNSRAHTLGTCIRALAGQYWPLSVQLMYHTVNDIQPSTQCLITLFMQIILFVKKFRHVPIIVNYNHNSTLLHTLLNVVLIWHYVQRWWCVKVNQLKSFCNIM